MTPRRGTALLVAVVVVAMAGAVVAGTLGWAMLQQRAGRSWRAATARTAVLESVAAQWRGGDSSLRPNLWTVVDSLQVARVSSGTEPGLLELVCWAASPDSGVPNCVPRRGFLRAPR
jgi:hypothetical protein